MFKTLPALRTFLLLLFAAVAVTAGDITLTLDDGSTVMLYENRTWESKSGNPLKLRADLSIDMQDGSAILLHPKGAWSYANGDSASSRPARPNITQLQAMAMAKKQNQSEATKAATAESLRRLVENFQKRLNDPTVPDSLARRCIESSLNQVMDVDTERKLDGAVQVRITLTDERIQDVLDCLGK